MSIEIEKNILQLSNFRGKIVVKISGYVSRRVEGALHQLSTSRPYGAPTRVGAGQGRREPLSLVATSETLKSAFFFLGTFSFCAYIGKKKKWTNGLGVFISVGLQRF